MINLAYKYTRHICKITLIVIIKNFFLITLLFKITFLKITLEIIHPIKSTLKS